MEPLSLNDPEKIISVLSQISLSGAGFTTDNLLGNVFDAGLIDPDFMVASGVDPDASYAGQSPAWATYHVRQGKQVFAVYGGDGKPRRFHISTTP